MVHLRLSSGVSTRCRWEFFFTREGCRAPLWLRCRTYSHSPTGCWSLARSAIHACVRVCSVVCRWLENACFATVGTTSCGESEGGRIGWEVRGGKRSVACAASVLQMNRGGGDGEVAFGIRRLGLAGSTPPLSFIIIPPPSEYSSSSILLSVSYLQKQIVHLRLCKQLPQNVDHRGGREITRCRSPTCAGNAARPRISDWKLHWISIRGKSGVAFSLDTSDGVADPGFDRVANQKSVQRVAHQGSDQSSF